MYYGGYPEYVSVADKEARALKTFEKLKKQNSDISPIIITGKKLANTWWGQAWNKNLESYSDYSNRIERGRTYVRHRAVLDLKIETGLVSGLVQGSGSTPYKVTITIKELTKKKWDKIIDACEGKLESLNEFLEGKFPKSMAELFTSHADGLFPSPKEISLNCNCPDWAIMCKHVAAVLYGIGTKFDQDPSLFFLLRNVDIEELLSRAITQKSETLLQKANRKSERVIDDNDIETLFGIEMFS